MLPEIRTTPIEYTISGFSLAHAPGKPFGPEIISILNRVWPVIKQANLAHDGINRVVYDEHCNLFAGVVLAPAPNPAAATLETKLVRLTHYAVWKHIGPYHLIPHTAAAMTKALESRGLQTGWPMVEAYGHWTNDESKLETETFVAIR